MPDAAGRAAEWRITCSAGFTGGSWPRGDRVERYAGPRTGGLIPVNTVSDRIRICGPDILAVMAEYRVWDPHGGICGSADRVSREVIRGYPVPSNREHDTGGWILFASPEYFTNPVYPDWRFRELADRLREFFCQRSTGTPLSAWLSRNVSLSRMFRIHGG